MDKAARDIDAATAAIGAAIKVGGPMLDAGDLISAIVALARSQPGYPAEAADRLAFRLMVSAVEMVGSRRAKQLVDVVAASGGGSAFS